jgi:hypothetical protein
MLSLRRSSGNLGLAVAAITAVGLQAAPALASHVGSAGPGGRRPVKFLPGP